MKENCECYKQAREDETKEKEVKTFLDKIKDTFKDFTKEPDLDKQIERSEPKGKDGDNILDRLGDMI